MQKMTVNRTGSKTETVKTILEAAASEFSSRGFSGARVDVIARRAKVNKATLYYHIGDKAAIYEAVLMDIFSTLKKKLEKSIEACPEPEKRIKLFIHAIAAGALENPCVPKLLLREIAGGMENLPQKVAGEILTVVGMVRDSILRGQRKGQFRKINPLLFHIMMAGSIMLLVASRDFRKKLLSGELERSYGPLEKEGDIPEFIETILLHGLIVKKEKRKK